MRSAKLRLVLTFAVSLLLSVRASGAADSLPTQLSDSEYWKLVTDYSEPDGYYQYTVITSNETAYQTVIPQLTKLIPAGGTYFGVGPEQNFTYIEALRPKLAFIIDIRRDMLLEHLMYKAVFEMSADRADFIANLFSRKRPTQLTTETPVATMFRAFASVPGDSDFANANLGAIITRLKATHGFTLSANDESRLRNIYLTFLREGVVNFNSSIESPGYTALMTATDGQGKNWSFLASEENYNRVRAMEQKNMIVPLVGDFAGPKALRAAGQYIRDHGAVVNLFYLSNVEDYIQNVVPAFQRNVASLPLDSSSMFIHLSLQANSFRPWLTSISQEIRGIRTR